MSVERERPVQSYHDLKLDRQPMVDVLVDAVVVPADDGDGWRSRGVVVGVSGPPGSGKTSLFNGLADRLVSRCADAVIVLEFSAHAMSGRADMIATFFAELRAKFKEYRKANHAASEVDSIVNALDIYATPFIRGVAKGERSHLDELREIEQSFQQISNREADTLNKLRSTLARQLTRANLPVIVLVDEIDQIRAKDAWQVAQLISTVMDFSAVSFVLSYDTERMVDLLGGGAVGYSNLAKMVQMQVELPNPPVDELKSMLRHEIEGVIGGAANSAGLDAAVDRVIPGVISTPRDVRRLAGAVYLLAGLSASQAAHSDAGDAAGDGVLPHQVVFAALDVAVPGFAARMARQERGAADGDGLAAHVLGRHAHYPAFRDALDTLIT